MTLAPIFTVSRLVMVLVAAAFLAACDEGGLVTRNDTTAPLLANKQNARGSARGDSALRRALNGPAPERRSIGTDEFLNEPRGEKDLFQLSDDGAITLNLVDVPIEQAAKAVLGDALKKNYTIKPGVEGSVTLQTTRPLSQKALLETFQTILELNGAALQTSGGLITIVPRAGAAQRIARAGQPQTWGRVLSPFLWNTSAPPR